MSSAYKMDLEGNFALGLLVWINPWRFGIWYNDAHMEILGAQESAVAMIASGIDYSLASTALI